MLSNEVLDIARRRQRDLDLWNSLIIEARAGQMSARDTRDLLMEFGCPETTATELLADAQALRST